MATVRCVQTLRCSHTKSAGCAPRPGQRSSGVKKVHNLLFKRPTLQALSINVLGTKLEPCNISPMTGFHRDGYCRTNIKDRGDHVICAQVASRYFVRRPATVTVGLQVTREFLDFTQSKGNDLTTPTAHFSGLRPGDRWCLCAARWKEALDANVAPKVVIAATESTALKYVTLEGLQMSAASFVTSLQRQVIRRLVTCLHVCLALTAAARQVSRRLKGRTTMTAGRP